MFSAWFYNFILSAFTFIKKCLLQAKLGLQALYIYKAVISVWVTVCLFVCPSMTCRKHFWPISVKFWFWCKAVDLAWESQTHCFTDGFLILSHSHETISTVKKSANKIIFFLSNCIVRWPTLDPYMTVFPAKVWLILSAYNIINLMKVLC